jgi:hypothetical protein
MGCIGNVKMIKEFIDNVKQIVIIKKSCREGGGVRERWFYLALKFRTRIGKYDLRDEKLLHLFFK